MSVEKGSKYLERNQTTNSNVGDGGHFSASFFAREKPTHSTACVCWFCCWRRVPRIFTVAVHLGFFALSSVFYCRVSVVTATSVACSYVRNSRF